MNKLIKFELKKLFKAKSFYICFLISIALVVLNALVSKSISDAANISVDSTSYILKFVSNGMLTTVLGIFTAIFVTDDYTCGTMKNIYAKGYSRNEVYLAKYIVSSISCLCFLALSLLSSILMSNVLFSTAVELSGSFITSIILEFVLMLAYNAIFFVISMVVEKLGSAVAFCIVGPSIVSLILTFIDSFLHLDKFNFSDFWLDTCLSSLQSISYESSVIISSIIISILVIICSNFIGLKLNSKKEF